MTSLLAKSNGGWRMGADEAAGGMLVAGPLGGGNDGIGRRSEDDPNLVVAHARTGEGHDASEDGTGRGTPLVIQEAQTGVREYTTAGSLRSNAPGTQPTGSLLRDASLVRRLTPLECERLQGFPDGWTCLCTPLAEYAADPDAAALACRCPDSPRYRALGNAVTVNVIQWIGGRLRLRHLAIALLACLLLVTPAAAEMRLPVAVQRHADGWVKLVYPPLDLEPGQAELVQLCLRAIRGIAACCHVNVVPVGLGDEMDRPGKVDVLVTESGFFPRDDGGTGIPYVTRRIQNLSATPMVYEIKVWVREHAGTP